MTQWAMGVGFLEDTPTRFADMILLLSFNFWVQLNFLVDYYVPVLQGIFPYELFVKLYNWNKLELRPCGLINCGNR